MEKAPELKTEIIGDYKFKMLVDSFNDEVNNRMKKFEGTGVDFNINNERDLSKKLSELTSMYKKVAEITPEGSETLDYALKTLDEINQLAK